MTLLISQMYNNEHLNLRRPSYAPSGNGTNDGLLRVDVETYQPPLGGRLQLGDPRGQITHGWPLSRRQGFLSGRVNPEYSVPISANGGLIWRYYFMFPDAPINPANFDATVIGLIFGPECMDWTPHLIIDGPEGQRRLDQNQYLVSEPHSKEIRMKSNP